jgi:hypothetical protein
MTKELSFTPYLIQRLESPRGYVSPFSFGGALRNGGFTKEAMDILNQILSFDYMGSAEFEWGALPECFKRISEDKREWVEEELKLKYKLKSKWDLRDGMTKEEGNVVFHIYAPKEIIEDVKTFISDAVKDEWKNNLKESLYFSSALTKLINGVTEGRINGWVDIENDYFFFIDKTMHDNVVKLFTGIRNNQEKEASA